MTTPQRYLAVVRPSGRAMFHLPECEHGTRAMSALLCVAADFAADDTCCSRCLPGGLLVEAVS